MNETMLDPYATHLPVLQTLGRTCAIRKVLEFGCGYHSTMAFLNRRWYPALCALDSVEQDPDWQRKIRKISSDARLTLCQPAVVRAIWFLLESYDLVFVDNGRSAADRVQTLRWLVMQQPSTPIIVIHDWEVAAYRQVAAPHFANVRECTRHKPHTAVLWNGERPELDDIEL